MELLIKMLTTELQSVVPAWSIFSFFKL